MAEKIARSICGFCHTNCGIKIHLRNSKITRIVGDPEHPANRGYLCAKAQSIKPMLESEERLQFPRIKTKSGLVRSSCDDALDFIAEKLTRIRQEYSPEALFHCHGAPVTYSARDGFMQFMGVYGCPNFTGAANLCHVPRQIAFNNIFGGRPEPDYERSRLIIFWGSNPVNTTRFTGYAACDGFNKILPRARERGAKVIVIDPVRSQTVEQADDWIQPKIGTDTALGLAMINTILIEGLYDDSFTDKWLLGFDGLRQHVTPLTPEWAEVITAVPAERIRDLARFYATAEGAIILDGNGMDMHSNGVDMARTVCLLIALTGNIDKPGGNVFLSFVSQTPLPTEKPAGNRMGLDEFPLFPRVPFPVLKESLLRETPGKPRAMIVHHANPVLIQANQKRTVQAFRKLDFLMVLDIFPTATTEVADVVLPAAADFEMVDYRCYSSTQGGFAALQDKIVEPLGEARSVFETEYELVKKMGMEQDYPFRNSEEWLNFVLQPTKITLDDLRQRQIIFASPGLEYNKYEKSGFNTPSGKVECYSEKFENTGLHTFPLFEFPNESFETRPELADRFPLMATTRRPAEFVHTKLVNLPTDGRHYPAPLLMMHTVDALARGIEQSDMVEVESSRGKVHLEAEITDAVVPGLVTIDFGWGNPTDNGTSINLLSSDDTWDPASGGYPNRLFLCEIKKLDEKVT